MQMLGADDSTGFRAVVDDGSTTITYAVHAGPVVDIDTVTIYRDDLTLADTLFNIHAGVGLVLTGDDVLNDDSLALSGQLRALGTTRIDDDLTLDDTTTFVNVGNAMVNGGEIYLGPSSTDAPDLRNLAGATLTLARAPASLAPASMTVSPISACCSRPAPPPPA